MTTPLDPIFNRSLDVINELGSLTRSGTRLLVNCQLKHGEAFLTRRGEHLREALRTTAERWPLMPQTVLQDAVASTLELAFESMLLTLAWQARSMRVIEQHAADARDALYTAAGNDEAAKKAIGKPRPGLERANKIAA